MRTLRKMAIDESKDYYGNSFFDDEISSDYIVAIQDLIDDTGGFYGPYKSKKEQEEKYRDILESSYEHGYDVKEESGSSFVVDNTVRVIMIPGLG